MLCMARLPNAHYFQTQSVIATTLDAHVFLWASSACSGEKRELETTKYF